eukprot:PLAT4441.1.p3 GENE.PLAT4441.1~~PLAT4441.1.p3  ORF type:complete len:119 (-),score=29.56 PLAT4441.1:97-453(-)
MARDGRLLALPKVRINSYATRYWRHQSKVDSSHLATIEAIYFLFKEYALAQSAGAYDGRFDGLLFYFAHQYDLIQNVYRRDSSRKIHSWLPSDYIRRDDGAEKKVADASERDAVVSST